MFRLDRQRWTRQSAATGTRATTPSFETRLRDWSSLHAHALALGWLTFGVVVLSGLV